MRPSVELWDEPVMRVALARHDLSTVYRLLQDQGYSQNAIGTLTGQAQPEICGIRHGRKVRTYDVLVRIAHGLGVPPGYMGLAWCDHVYGDDAPPATGDAPPATRDAPSTTAWDCCRRDHGPDTG